MPGNPPKTIPEGPHGMARGAGALCGPSSGRTLPPIGAGGDGHTCTALALALVALLTTCAACHSQPPAGNFRAWTGEQAPAGLPIIEPALAAGRAVVLHFTGEAGPDNIAVTLTLNRLRERYGADVVFVRAENETTEGNKVFDAFKAARIPSVAVLDSAGLVVGAFEGRVGETDLAKAIDEARSHPVRDRPPGGLSVYDLGAPLPSTTGVVGKQACPSVPLLKTALSEGKPVVVAFLGAYSRFDSEQAAALDQVAAADGDAVEVVKLYAEDGAAEPAFHDYFVTGVPAVFVVGPTATVAKAFDGLVSGEALVAAVDAVKPPPPPEPVVETRTEQPPPGTGAETTTEPSVGSAEHTGAQEPPPTTGTGPPPTGNGNPPPDDIKPPHDEDHTATAEGPGPPEASADHHGGTETPVTASESPEPKWEPEAHIKAAAGSGDPSNPLSPAAGTDVAVSSAAGSDYGPERLVDGLVAGDMGFKPWVTGPAQEPPYVIEIRFPQTRRLSSLELYTLTGDRALFGGRWICDYKILTLGPVDKVPREWATGRIDPLREKTVLQLRERAVDVLIIRILSTQSGERACEMAEIRSR